MKHDVDMSGITLTATSVWVYPPRSNDNQIRIDEAGPIGIYWLGFILFSAAMWGVLISAIVAILS